MIADIPHMMRDAWQRAWSFRWGKRERHRLRDFEADIRQQTERFGPPNRRTIGIRNIDISRIVGSVGRTAEFDADFQPLLRTTTTIERFNRVLRLMRDGEPLPPIDLYKIRRRYYVLDGHHRVGAARQLGVEWLEADVTLFIPSGDPEAVRLYHERMAFERATGLRSIGAALPRTYRRLLVEVHEYRRELADKRGIPVDLSDAAMQWYARVFLPAFGIIRNSGIQPYVPSLRHADMLASMWDDERTARRRLQEAEHSHATHESPLKDGLPLSAANEALEADGEA